MQPDREHAFAVDAAFLAEAEALIATAAPADEELAAV
jgi:hypothetical protein